MYYPNLKLYKIEHSHIHEFFTYLLSAKCVKKNQPLSNGYLKKIKTCILVPLKWAHKEDLLNKKLNPNNSFPIIRNNEIQHRGILTESEQKSLLEYKWENQKAYLGFEIAFYCGLRLGEIRALRFSDFINGFIKVKRAYNDVDKLKATKTGSCRSVPCPDFLVKQIIDFKKENKLMDRDLIFHNTNNKSIPVDENYFTRNFYSVLKKLKIPRIRFNSETNLTETICFHSLRHQTATRWVSSGLDLRVIAKAMGHSPLILQQRYSNHYDQEIMKNFRNKLIETGIFE